MKLSDAIEILKNTYYYPTEMKRTQEAVETVLQVLTIPDNKDVCFVGGGRTKGRTLTRTYEFGLIVGTKRERVYWEDKIKEKIEELDKNELLGKYNYEQVKIAIDILNELLIDKEPKKYSTYEIQRNIMPELLKGE